MTATVSPPTDAAAGAGWTARARETLQQLDARLARRYEHHHDNQGEVVRRLTALRARAVDDLLCEAWAQCVPPDAPLALFAVGGYGRGELFPHSDIDVLVLAGEAAQQDCHERLACLFAMLWDAGLAVSHAVRSPAQCREAAADQTVLTALIEARPLVADAATTAALATAVAPAGIWPARDYFLAKVEELRERHARFGDTSDNLEPNIKDGPGGLRDLHTLGWMALRAFGVSELEPLVGLGHVGADEAAALQRERERLDRLRYGLHLVAGRAEERLRFEHQKALASRLGFEDDDRNLGVEQMMQGFYRSAALVRRVSERLLQRFEEHFDGEAVPEAIDGRFELRRGYLAAREEAWPRDVGDVFALFATWAARHSVRGLHSQTARALAEALPRLPTYEVADDADRAAFMGLLRGPKSVATLERMARLGVLGRWLPAFADVSGRMQFDLFHVYTVDQHTLAVLRNVAGFASGEDARFSIVQHVWPRLPKPELLLLAALFHDIAKGRGGDHSELGAVDARAFCRAHGLSQGETDLVAWLVEKHLLMSVTAQKQDITDPVVIHRFAGIVADRERLDYLYLLTCADIAGTSPKLWNAWKDRLLADLYTVTRLALRRGLEHPVAADERIAETRDKARAQLVAEGMQDAEVDALFARMPEIMFLRGRPDQVAWQARGLDGLAPGATRVMARRISAEDKAMALEIFVHSPNRDGLFAAIVATLDRLGMAVLRARVLHGPDDTIFDTFEVAPTDTRRAVHTPDIERKLQAVLAAPLDSMRPSRRTQPRHMRHFRISPQVGFDVMPGGFTGVSLVCTDRPGLLADIAQVLRAQRLRVHDARIATFGERVEDVFKISDERDEPLDDARQQALRTALLQTFDGDRTG